MLQNISCLASCRSKNVQKSARAAFLTHLDIVDVMVICQFTQSQRNSSATSPLMLAFDNAQWAQAVCSIEL